MRLTSGSTPNEDKARQDLSDPEVAKTLNKYNQWVDNLNK